MRKLWKLAEIHTGIILLLVTMGCRVIDAPPQDSVAEIKEEISVSAVNDPNSNEEDTEDGSIMVQDEKVGKIKYKSEEQRYENPYFFPNNQERQDMTVQFFNLENDGQRGIHMTKKYLFSHDGGDVYAITYPSIQYGDALEVKGDEELVGYFYVNEDIIIDIGNWNLNDMPSRAYDRIEEWEVDMEYGHPVCYTNLSMESIEKYYFDQSNFDYERFVENSRAVFYMPEYDWEVTIFLDGEYAITSMRTVDTDFGFDNRYGCYVWKKGEGLVGYQYGMGVGGGQHDFYTDENIFKEFLDRGW